MRLCTEQSEAIEQEAGRYFSARAQMRQSGFTMVELITVIVILGIISVVALPRLFDNNMFESRAAADQVKSALRYGQKVAVARHAPVAVSVSAAAEQDCSPNLQGGTVSCLIKNNVAVDQALPWVVVFDRMGRPAAAASIKVGTTTINVAAETGYVSYAQ